MVSNVSVRCLNAMVLAVLVGGCDAGEYRVVVEFEAEATLARVEAIEVALVAGGCDAQALGAPPSVPTRTTVLRRASRAGLGDAPPGGYGLYATARDASCQVLAAGCTDVTLVAGGSGTLTVALADLDGSRCAPSFCDRGVCAAGDAGVRDGGALDAGFDGGLPDGGSDGGSTDGGPPDSGALDAGTPPLLHYPFDEPGAPGRESGGSGHDLVCAGACSVVSDDMRGEVLELDGSSCMALELAPERVGMEPLTVAVWAYIPMSARGSIATVVRDDHKQCDNVWQVESDDGISAAFAFDEIGSPRKNGVEIGAVDRWVHLAFTFDGARLRFFVDGVEAGGRDSGALASGPGTLYVGCEYGIVDATCVQRLEWDGRIDDVRVYDAVLSDADIAALAGS